MVNNEETSLPAVMLRQPVTGVESSAIMETGVAKTDAEGALMSSCAFDQCYLNFDEKSKNRTENKKRKK